jgi:hypothetical protein
MQSLSHKLTEREAKEVIQRKEEEQNRKKNKPVAAPVISPASQHDAQKWMAKLATFEVFVFKKLIRRVWTMMSLKTLCI